MKILKILLVSFFTVTITGCASMTPTREFTEHYVIYNISEVDDHREIAENVKEVLQTHTKNVVVNHHIPPYPLPEKPGRFTVHDPLANSPMGALLGAGGANVKAPKCDDATFSAYSNDPFEGVENTTFFVCLLPYVDGYHMNIYYTFTKVSGGFSAQMLGKSLARSLVGDSSQFIPRTIAALRDAAAQTGGTVELVESYPTDIEGIEPEPELEPELNET